MDKTFIYGFPIAIFPVYFYANDKYFAASVLKEKLLALGSSGILADHQLQAQLQEHHLKGSVYILTYKLNVCSFVYIM